MTWSKDDWECQVCRQVTKRPGPWCRLYCGDDGVDCPPRIAEQINIADAQGDGSLVNGLCYYARALYGEGLYW